MRFDPIFGLAALALAGLWCATAGAQSDSTAPGTPVAGAAVIHLHMPGEAIHLHRLRHRAPEAVPPAGMDTSVARPAVAAEPPAAVPAQHSPTASRANGAAHAGAGSRNAVIPFNFGEDSAPPAESGPTPPPSASGAKTASLPPRASAPTHASPPASDDDRAGLTKHGAVLFDKGIADPSPAQFKGVKLLAGDLATALESGASRVQLDAYGGAPGDKSSDARRLSLKRALAVRQLLIDNGVPSNRIDVRAMGGIDDKGPTDRVDVFVRTG